MSPPRGNKRRKRHSGHSGVSAPVCEGLNRNEGNALATTGIKLPEPKVERGALPEVYWIIRRKAADGMDKEKLSRIMAADELEEAHAAGKLEEYIALVASRRDWAGLVSRGMALSPEEAVIDSIGLAGMLPRLRGGKAVDIGSGAGLLGIVVALLRPELCVCLAEVATRKAAFLAEAVGTLGLENATVSAQKAQALPSNSLDVAMSRAAGDLAEVAPVALDLLRRGGLYFALKGSEVQQEVERAAEAIGAAGGRLIGIQEPEHQIAGLAERRSLVVVIEKGV